jgi:imidazolonepropionase-like amidohydrolase
MVRRACAAGVPIYVGSDAGGGIRHGRIADEIAALHAAGLPAADALAAASWSARGWLGRPGLEAGAAADLVGYRSDPRTDLGVLREPAVIMRNGRVVRAT